MTSSDVVTEITEDVNSQESMTSSENSSDQKLSSIADIKQEEGTRDSTDQRPEQTTDAEIEVSCLTRKKIRTLTLLLLDLAASPLKNTEQDGCSVYQGKNYACYGISVVPRLEKNRSVGY